MVEIRVEKLNEESFRKYGEFQDLTNDEQMISRNFFDGSFYADLIRLDFANTTITSVSCCSVKKSERMIVDFMEYHANTCEGILPLDDDVIIYVGALKFGNVMDIKNLRAFYVPKWTFVKLNANVIHGAQFPARNDKAHLLCLLPAGTYGNDFHGRTVEAENEKGIIIG